MASAILVLSALPTDISSQMGAGHIVSLLYTRRSVVKNTSEYMKYLTRTAEKDVKT